MFRKASFRKQQEYEIKLLELQRKRELSKAVNKEEIDEINARFNALELGIKNLETPLDKFRKQLNDAFKTDALNQLDEQLKSLGATSLKNLLDFTVTADGKVQNTFIKQVEALKGTGQEWAIYARTIASVMQDVYGIMSQNSQAYFDEQYQRLEAQYQYQLQFANGNAEEEAQLNEDLAKRKREIANQEAKAKKEATIFNIILNTAQGVTAALATVPPNPILAGIIGGLGLAQLAMVSSREVPQYYKGRKGGGAELAITDELGAELHTDKHGNIKDFGTNKGARYKWLDAGDIIYTADETLKYQKAIASTFDNKPYNYTQNATLIREKEFIPFQNVNVNIDKNGINTLITTTAKKSSIMNSYYNLKGIKL